MNETRKNCKLRKLKGCIRQWWTPENKDTILTSAVYLIGIWLIITGLMWGFTQKAVTVHECKNVTGQNVTYPGVLGDPPETYCHFAAASQWGYGSDEDGPCLSTRQTCIDTVHNEFYTIPEIMGQQWGFITGTVSGTFGWVVSHPVI